jgi:RimJ/RimL family protein N-acetyltransferase
MRLELENAVVRPFARGDEESIARHANNRNVWRNLRDRFPHPYTLDDARNWIAFLDASTPVTNWAIEVDGEVVGGIGITLQSDVFHRSAEIGYWLGEAHWGRGVATAVLRATTDHVFASFDLCRLFAGVFAWNPASARVLEKAGYAFEGRMRRAVVKDGATVDQLLYASVRE